jgi:hypothetical protein
MHDEKRVETMREVFEYMSIFAKYRLVYWHDLSYCQGLSEVVRPSLAEVAMETYLKGAAFHHDCDVYLRLLQILTGLLLTKDRFNRPTAVPCSVDQIDHLLNLGGDEFILRNCTNREDHSNCDDDWKLHFQLFCHNLLKALRDSIVDGPLDHHA